MQVRFLPGLLQAFFMFYVIYKFEVREGKKEKFLEAWAEMTLLIRKHANGLGSRLHIDQQGKHIAYAKWNSKADWENAQGKLPEAAKMLSQIMKESCTSIETLHQLEELKDLSL